MTTKKELFMEQDVRCTNNVGRSYAETTETTQSQVVNNAQIADTATSKPAVTEQPVEDQKARAFLKRIAQGHMHNR